LGLAEYREGAGVDDRGGDVLAVCKSNDRIFDAELIAELSV
jgi:hypothetical protein